MEAVRLQNIVKQFPGVLANDHINLKVRNGEIHAIVGENGAGKTTLMRILYGMDLPDQGEIFIRGKKVHLKSPIDAIHAGLGMVHQEFRLFPSLTVCENIVFGNEPNNLGFFDKRKAIEETRDIASKFGFQLDPEALIGDLPVGVRQRVEILKALYRNAQILILDEPTAVLTPQERDELFEILRNLTEHNKTVIFITHKLNEVMSISDNVTVLRAGKVTADLETSKTSPSEIAKHMVGSNVLLDIWKPPVEKGDVVLELCDLTIGKSEGKPTVDSVSFILHSNEILGIAGVAGNGQTELVEAITGLRVVDGGQIFFTKKDITHAPIGERRAMGLAYVPEDRGKGLAYGAQVNENLIMNYQYRENISRKGWLNLKGISKFALELIKTFSIKVTSQFEKTSSLSGGNQQKIVVAREFSHPKLCLIIAEQPTRGLDIASTEFMYQQLIKHRSEGAAILLISADLNEIMSLSDSILVMYEGKVMGEILTPENTTESEIGLLMAGIKKTLAPNRLVKPA